MPFVVQVYHESNISDVDRLAKTKLTGLRYSFELSALKDTEILIKCAVMILYRATDHI